MSSVQPTNGTSHPLIKFRDRLIELGVKPDRAMKIAVEEWMKAQAQKRAQQHGSTETMPDSGS